MYPWGYMYPSSGTPGLDDDFKMANKVFWQTIRRLREKRSQVAFFIEGSNGVTLKNQDAILNRWVERIL